MTSVLYLDRYHLGDPLFLNGLARDVLAFPGPLVLVHGAGEAAERALEAQGRIPQWRDGVLVVESSAGRALVERAARDLNRRIVHTLNDAGVSAVRLDAGSRGLFRAGEVGPEVKNLDWLRALVAQGVVPVVAALLEEERGAPREVSGGAVAGLLADAFTRSGESSCVLALVKNGAYAPESGDRAFGAMSPEALPEERLPEPEAIRAALAAGAETRLIGRSDLRLGASGGLSIAEGVDNKSARMAREGRIRLD